ncbi:MAG: TolC family protein [Lutibacter sp.]|uniref:TolC family protein n=1 Tax=Lutibacter sp. TaxID=1925666 RepID=UPI00385D7018
MKKIGTIILLLITFSSFGQEKLNLETCYSLVNKNYPLAKQNEMLVRQNTLDKEIIKTGKLPKLDFDAQATYQSDVIELPLSIPGVTITPPNKDQYKATVSVNQLVYDGGLINASTKVKEVTLKTQQKTIEVNLYQLKKEVNQLYFSIILLQEKRALLDAKKTQLETKLKEVKSGIEFGVLLPTSDKVLEAELLKIDQQYTEIDQSKISLIKTLSSVIGEDISLNVSLESPTVLSSVGTEIKRPELDLFQLQKEQINASEQLIAKKNTPKLMGFATGGYGNPGLNMLDNSFQAYYMVGLKLNWNIFDWNARKKEQKSLKINKEIIDNQQEIFTLNTNIELDQQQTEIAKITSFIESDKTIIELREKILKSAASQLKNGVITSSAYITELTNLYEAENNLSTHKIELLLAKANYKTTKGN